MDNYQEIRERCFSTLFTSENSLDELVFGCGCEETCIDVGDEDEDDDDCLCFAQHTCFYDKHGRLNIGEVNEPIYECNACCACLPTCRNRNVQRGSPLQLAVKETANKGFGLFASEVIPKGSFVIEYIGEVITQSEAVVTLQQILETDKSCFVFALKEHYGESQRTLYVDASEKGNRARFINHSCQPNLQVMPVRVNTIFPHLTLFACRDISVGEELCFHYGSSSSLDVSVGEGVSSSLNTKIGNLGEERRRLRCYCDAPSCMGVVPFDETAAL